MIWVVRVLSEGCINGISELVSSYILKDLSHPLPHRWIQAQGTWTLLAKHCIPEIQKMPRVGEGLPLGLILYQNLENHILPFALGQVSKKRISSVYIDVEAK